MLCNRILVEVGILTTYKTQRTSVMLRTVRVAATGVQCSVVPIDKPERISAVFLERSTLGPILK